MPRRLSALFVLPLLALATGCAVFAPTPQPTTLEDRLAFFPTEQAALEGPVTIRWNAQKVPFIEASTDSDAAYTLGLVHAHLRLAQMEFLKRVSQGRLSEMAGPFTTEIDTALRAVGYGRASQEILANMPAESRAWLDRYVEGVNHYKQHAEATGRLPHNFTVLDWDNEPWTAEDTITLGRLTGTDVNWIVSFGLLLYADDPEFDNAVDLAIRYGLDSTPSFEDRGTGTTAAATTNSSRISRSSALYDMAQLTVPLSRSGSNSIVVAPERSASGSALIANDPHLGFFIPNAWVIGGLKSPSYNVVGMMVPGVPVFGFGRNTTLAWGGTNLRSMNSDLVDVSDLPTEAFTTETHEIGVRLWFDETHETRMSPYGPVVTDAETVPLYKGRSFALRWTGHLPSDEITALLGAMKAPDWATFREAVEPFGIPAQNFLVADSNGTIGHTIATHIPNRPPEAFTAPLVISPEDADAPWQDIQTGADLPFVENPPEGFIASTNNRPTDRDDVVIGRFFPADERIRRLQTLLGENDSVTLDDLAAYQQDVYSPLSITARDAILARAGERDDPVLTALADWDGQYSIDSSGAAVFEAFLTGFSAIAYGFDPDDQTIYGTMANRGYARRFMIADAGRMSDGEWDAAVATGLAAGAKVLAEGKVWGDQHRLTVQSVLGQIPVLGARYRFDDIPVPGSRETVFKSSHTLTAEGHNATFGSQSRHLSDLSDPDANYFVLYGGQDDWVNSANEFDQVRMWQEGTFIQMPLSESAVRESFPFVTELTPRVTPE